MKGRIALLFCILSFASVLSGAQDGTSAKEGASKATTPEPYKRSEFPEWALDLRRAEAVAFGSLPFTVFFAQTIIETYRCSQHDWDRAYAPWPVKTTGGVPLSSDEFGRTFAIGCVGAVAFAAVDYFIFSVKRKKARRLESERPAATYTVERSPADRSEEFGETPIPHEGPPNPSQPAAPATP